MKKTAVLAALALLTVAVSAQAAPQYTPAPPPKPHKPPKAHQPPKSHHHPPKSHRCSPHNVGYYATGTLVSASLTPDPDGHNRYSGTLEVDLTRANHRAPTGDQTFTLDQARVRFHHGVDPTAPAAGSRVKLHGKVTALAKRCPSEGFTPTITIKKVDVSQPPAHPRPVQSGP